MNKSVRNLIILVAVLFGLGVGSMTVGMALGGQFMTVGWGPQGFHNGPLGDAPKATTIPAVPGAPAAPKAPAAPGTGNVQGEIQSLTISLGACEVFVLDGDAFNLEVTGNGPQVVSTVEDGIWTISNEPESHNWRWWHDKLNQKVVITLPKGFVAQELYVEIGAGRLEAQTLSAKTAYLTVGAGELEIDQMTSQETSIGSGMGTIQVDKATLTGGIYLDCGMGEIEVTLEGQEADYGYDCTVGMGQISIGDADTAGLGGEMNRSIEGDNFITANCGMGTIKVDFTR